MHICCANCALYPLKSLERRGIEVLGLWFNPNIHPYAEYSARLGALKELEGLWKREIHYVDHYGLEEFVRAVAFREEDRCSYCYSVRLDKTARRAAELGVDGFTTTLLVSPYQDFDKIVAEGERLQHKYDVEFFAEDFRRGWREGMRISRELGLYRQKYCGCIYSEMERHLGGNGGGRRR